MSVKIWSRILMTPGWRKFVYVSVLEGVRTSGIRFTAVTSSLSFSAGYTLSQNRRPQLSCCRSCLRIHRQENIFIWVQGRCPEIWLTPKGRLLLQAETLSLHWPEIHHLLSNRDKGGCHRSQWVQSVIPDLYLKPFWYWLLINTYVSAGAFLIKSADWKYCTHGPSLPLLLVVYLGLISSFFTLWSWWYWKNCTN